MDKDALLAEFLKTGVGAAAKMNPVTAGLSILPSAYQFISGLAQTDKAKKIEEANKRPTQYVPNPVTTATGIARNQYFDPTLPGQNIAEARLGTTVANAIDATKQIGAGGAGQLGAVAAAEMGRQQGLGDIQARAEQQNLADSQNYQNALYREAPWRQQAWEYNVAQPYQQAADAASALRQAGNTNMFGALSNAATAAINTDFSGKQKVNAPKMSSTPSMSTTMPAPDLTSMGSGRLPNQVNNFGIPATRTQLASPTFRPGEDAMQTEITPLAQDVNYGYKGSVMPINTIKMQVRPIPSPFTTPDLASMGSGREPIKLPKAPKGSLYGDELYQRLPPPMIYK